MLGGDDPIQGAKDSDKNSLCKAFEQDCPFHKNYENLGDHQSAVAADQDTEVYRLLEYTISTNIYQMKLGFL